MKPSSGHPNVLILTLDSCRWDTFVNARTPIIDSLCITRSANAQATFTYPAHLAIYQGHLPNTREPIAYYNRFTKSLFRIAKNDAAMESFITFPRGTRNFVHGFRSLGYYSIGVGAMEWFRHSDLTSPFHEFHFTGINADFQIEKFLSCIAGLDRAFVGLINFGETHEPYHHGGQIPGNEISRARATARRKLPTGFDNENWLKQISSCEFLDGRIGYLIDRLKDYSRGTVVVLCADHGECFGEDELYGHGFYHPKVMEVPLGIFAINYNLDESSVLE